MYKRKKQRLTTDLLGHYLDHGEAETAESCTLMIWSCGMIA